MLIVGLTGGIGSGKSAASAYFETLGVIVVDADIVARQVVEPGKPALSTISKQFGADILLEDGSLNRPRLREIIFSDSNAKKWLEALLHPLIRSEIILQLSEASSPYAILVSPLLFETKQSQLCSRSLLIDVPEAIQTARASQRDGVSPDAIQAVIEVQMPRDEKRKRASDIILNDKDLTELHAQIEHQHAVYLELATTNE
jgi:dephospho-CoA kinase